jgi:helix-turn-helix protein
MDRQVRRRLAVLRHAEEITGNAAVTCPYFGVTRQTYYTWLCRYETQGIDGLRDSSRRRRHSPTAAGPGVIDKILSQVLVGCGRSELDRLLARSVGG